MEANSTEDRAPGRSHTRVDKGAKPTPRRRDGLLNKRRRDSWTPSCRTDRYTKTRRKVLGVLGQAMIP